MKKIILLLISLSIFAFAAQPDWSKLSFYQTIIEAKKQNKLVLVYFSKTDNAACEYMSDITFDNSDTIEYINEYFIPIEINILNTPIPSGFKVFATPTIYLLDSRGQKIGKHITGLIGYKKFIKEMKYYRKLAK